MSMMGYKSCSTAWFLVYERMKRFYWTLFGYFLLISSANVYWSDLGCDLLQFSGVILAAASEECGWAHPTRHDSDFTNK